MVCLIARPAQRGIYGAPALINGAATLPPRCLRLAVQRCRYCVQERETLAGMLRSLVTSSSWLILWAANGNVDPTGVTIPITDPDLLMASSANQVREAPAHFGFRSIMCMACLLFFYVLSLM